VVDAPGRAAAGEPVPYDTELLEEVVATLAAVPDRGSARPGELQAAEWLADRFRRYGCRTAVEEEPAHGTYWWPLGLPTAAGAVAGLAALRGSRWPAAAVAATAAATVAGEVTSRFRGLRRLLPQRTCWNVVAETGDASASRTVLVLAHHDAPRTGRLFDQTWQRAAAERFPELMERIETAPPLVWALVAGPALVAAGAATGRRGVTALGTATAALGTAIFADVARSPVSPGANDNLSGVAGLVQLAAAFQRRPVSGVRVLLVSCGAEESMQEGILAFGARHFAELPTERTWVVNLESVGSPHLVLLEGEGPLVMQDYQEPFKDVVEDVAAERGIKVRRGLRARTTTDSLITDRAGYPTATLVSVNDHKALENYHLMSDLPENLDYGTVSDAARLAEEVVRHLAAQPG
jgi:Zn-dependent M28 family amino/carboxypeptidase